MKKQLEQIIKGLDNLPGTEGQMIMAPKHRSKDYRLPKTGYKESAVSLILFNENNFLKSILIQRPTYDGAHSGQVAFPGGKLERNESTLEAAIRETKEEIDLKLDHSNHIGSLTNLFIPVSNFMVTPHVFFIENLPKLTKEEREVESIFSFPINHVNNPEFRLIKDINVGKMILKDVPYFDIKGKVVWGATAIILSEFAEILKK